MAAASCVSAQESGELLGGRMEAGQRAPWGCVPAGASPRLGGCGELGGTGAALGGYALPRAEPQGGLFLGGGRGAEVLLA